MSDTVTFKGEVRRTTPGAIFALFDIDDVERWIPRSVCADGDDVEVGDTDLVIKTWWARKEGLE